MSSQRRREPTHRTDESAAAGAVALAAEDPGAAAFLAGVIACASPSQRFRLGACGAAAPWFEREGLHSEPFDALMQSPPRVLVFGTGEDPNGPTMQLQKAAQARGVTTVAVVDADIAVLDRFRPMAGGAPCWPDHFLVVSDRAVETLRGAGVDTSCVHVVGGAALDRLVSRRTSAPHTEHARTLLFMAEPPGGYASLMLQRDDRYRLDGWSRPLGRTETVLEELILALEARAKAGDESRDSVRLVIRPHPKCPPTQFDAYRERVHAIDATDTSWRAILAAHAVVGLTSAALDESVVLERPTLSIVPVPEESAWLRSAEHGLIPSVSTRVELRAAIAALLDEPTLPTHARVEGALALGGGRRAAAIIDLLARRVADEADEADETVSR